MSFMKWRIQMTKALVINNNYEKGLIEFLKNLLDTGKVKGVFSLKKINKHGDVSYSLITKSEDLDEAVPFYPVMPVNAGYLLSRFTMKKPSTEPIIVVLKPCEIRAFIELIKREQGSLENLYILSFTCGGVYTHKMVADELVEKNLPKYWDAVKKEEILNDLRPACQSCEEFSPYNADITVDLIGKGDIDKQTIMFLNNEKAENLAKDFKGKIVEKEFDKKKFEGFKSKREKEKLKLFKEIEPKIKGLDNLIDTFGKCISCHACGRVCPICYCTVCEFESPDSEYKPSNFETELNKRGAMRVPPGTIYYQLGRLDHIAISCVGCGACEDVCPVDIPVSLIFKNIGESVQKLFDYTPGKNLEEDLPLCTFKKEELVEYEE